MTYEMGIIVSGAGPRSVYPGQSHGSGRRLPYLIYPLTRKTGLFSVPAPSQHPCGVRRGFLFDIALLGALNVRFNTHSVLLESCATQLTINRFGRCAATWPSCVAENFLVVLMRRDRMPACTTSRLMACGKRRICSDCIGLILRTRYRGPCLSRSCMFAATISWPVIKLPMTGRSRRNCIGE